MRRLLALAITLGLAVWAQSFAPKREFPWDALALYAASAVVLVLGVLPGLPERLAHAGGRADLLARLPGLQRRGWLLVAAGVLLSLVASVRFLGRDYATPTMVVWLAGLTLAVVGAHLLRPHPPTARAARAPRPAWELWGFGLVLLVALFMRTYQLDALPNGLYLDEADNGLEALRLFTLPTYVPFTPVSNGHPTLFLYLLGLGFHAFGATPYAMRAVLAMMGVVTVAAFYPLARRLFPPWLALALTFLLAVSHWHVNFSRVGFEGILTPLAAILTFYWLWRGMETRRPLHFAWAGLSLGFGMHTYLPARVLPGIVVAFLLAVLLFDRERWRGRVVGTGLTVVVALIVFAPLAAHFWNNPNDFYNRASQAAVTLDIEREKSNQPLYENIKKTFVMFNWQGDPRPRHNLPGEPDLDWVTAVFYALGFAYAVARWRQPRQALLLAWLFLMFTPGVLSLADSNPHSLRTIGNIPVVFLFAGLFLEAAYGTWRAAFGDHGRRAVLGLLLVALGWSGLANYNTYFNIQANNRSVWYDFDPAQTAVAYFVRQHAPTERVYVAPGLVNHPTVRFIPRGASYQPLDLNRHIPIRESVDRDVVYVLESTHTAFLQQLQMFYPNGRAETRLDKYNQPMFSTFSVSQEEVARLQGVEVRYYAGLEEGSAPVQRAQSKEVGANWQGQTPLPPPFRAEWSGSLAATGFGVYTFILESSGEAALAIDDQEVLPAGSGHREARWEMAGGFHSLNVKMVQTTAEGRLQLAWVPPGGRQEVVPSTVLYNFPASKNGLVGRYYSNNNWSGQPALIRVDNFVAAHNFLPDPFSVEWQGQVYAPRAGVYLIGTNSDDGSMVWIDGKLAVDNGGHHSDRYVENRVQLAEGLHELRIRYFQDDGGRKFELWWTPPGGARGLVPMSNLFPPGLRPSREELAGASPLPLAAVPSAPASAALATVSLQTAGTFGGPGQLKEPRGVAADGSGNMYVADTGNRRVQVLGPAGNPLRAWGREGKGDGEFEEPFAITLNSRGEVLVLDSISGDVQRFSAEGKFLGRIKNGVGLYRPRGMTLDQQGNIYIADTGGNRVVKLGPDGQPLGQFGGQGAGPGQFDQPVDVAVDAAGSMWVVDAMNGRLQALDNQGRYRGEGAIGRAGTFNGSHVSFSQDALFVTAPEGGQVLVFSREAAPAAQLAGPGTQPGQLGVPVGITVDTQGNLYVTEVGNHRVQKFVVSR